MSVSSPVACSAQSVPCDAQALALRVEGRRTGTERRPRVQRPGAAALVALRGGDRGYARRALLSGLSLLELGRSAFLALLGPSGASASCRSSGGVTAVARASRSCAAALLAELGVNEEA